MKQSKTNEGFLFILEKIVRSHPLLYVLSRSLIRFTNIFEQDFYGIKLLNLKKQVNIIDVGASDGIASKFFNRHLNIGTIICFEPNKYYTNILKKINIKNLIVKQYAIGNTNSHKNIFFPRYKFFFKNLDLLPYTFYDKKILVKQLACDFKFRKNISIVKEKIFTRKIKKINKKIDLIKIDTNGIELSVVKSLINIIKRDRPALIIEFNQDDTKIKKLLKKFSYTEYYYSINKKEFNTKKRNYSINRYYLQKKHLI